MAQIERDEEPPKAEEDRCHESPAPDLPPTHPHVGKHLEQEREQHRD